jgi:hypothetical protein
MSRWTKFSHRFLGQLASNLLDSGALKLASVVFYLGYPQIIRCRRPRSICGLPAGGFNLINILGFISVFVAERESGTRTIS